MSSTPRTFKTRLRVRYAETDQMGVVYHSNYFVWFELGRVELMRELGFTYGRMESEEDCVLPVVEVTCRYRSPARYDDELELETRLSSMRGPILKFAYQLRRCPAISQAQASLASQPPAHPKGQPSGTSLEGDLSLHLNGAECDTLLAEAATTHVVVDRNLKRRALPEHYAAALYAVLGRERET